MFKIIIREMFVMVFFRWKLYNVIISYVFFIKFYWYKNLEEEEEKFFNIRKFRIEIFIIF